MLTNIVVSTGSDDMARRYAFNYLIGLVGSSFSGILAYAFIQMHGLAGLQAWQVSHFLSLFPRLQVEELPKLSPSDLRRAASHGSPIVRLVELTSFFHSGSS